jgi:nucleoside 2-deoxyribosyltransferase
MRIYLACTVRGDRGTIETARHIHDCLVRLGHEVLTAHLLEDDVDTAESRLGDRDVFSRDLAWVEAADAIVAEASGSSYGVGFEVGYTMGRAVQTGQRVLVLYDASRRGKISRLISGLDDPRTRILAYESPADIEPFLREQLGHA